MLCRGFNNHDPSNEHKRDMSTVHHHFVGACTDLQAYTLLWTVGQTSDTNGSMSSPSGVLLVSAVFGDVGALLCRHKTGASSPTTPQSTSGDPVMKVDGMFTVTMVTWAGLCSSRARSQRSCWSEPAPVVSPCVDSRVRGGASASQYCWRSPNPPISWVCLPPDTSTDSPVMMTTFSFWRELSLIKANFQIVPSVTAFLVDLCPFVALETDAIQLSLWKEPQSFCLS